MISDDASPCHTFTLCTPLSRLLPLASPPGLLAHGVTSFCPTIITSSRETYASILPHIKRTLGTSLLSQVIGVHCEGPFINPEKKGAHAEELIVPITKDPNQVNKMASKANLYHGR